MNKSKFNCFLAETGAAGIARLVLLAVASIAFGLSLGDAIPHLRAVFSEPLEDMSHGWLIPVFSLYAAWTARTKIRDSAGSPSWTGALLVLLSCATVLFGTRGMQVRFEILGLALGVLSIPWAFFGKRTARHFLFPAAFLLFMMPLTSALDFFTIHLRMAASAISVAVLNGFGFDVVREGTAIVAKEASQFNIDVASPCSGLRSLFALMALTAGYAHFNQPTWKRRIALFLCSLPIAVLGNIIRVVSICLVAASFDRDTALGYYHDYSGYVVFIVAIFLMLAASDVIDRLAKKRRAGKTDDEKHSEEEKTESGESRPPRPKIAFRQICPAFTTTIFCAALFSLIKLSAPCLYPPDIPISIPEAIDGFRADEIVFCHNESCASEASFTKSFLAANKLDSSHCPHCTNSLHKISLGEKTVLPEDTVIEKRVFTDVSTLDTHIVTFVKSGRSKGSIHRPELCLPAQGFSMLSPHNSRQGEIPWHILETLKPGLPSSRLSYTFFNQKGFVTSSHYERILYDMWDRTVNNTMDRWVMITVVSKPASYPGIQTSSKTLDVQTEKFLKLLAEKLLPEINRSAEK